MTGDIHRVLLHPFSPSHRQLLQMVLVKLW
jgi:hypothetical protein